MNRVLLGILCGVLFGAIDASMALFGKGPEKSTTVLLEAFVRLCVANSYCSIAFIVLVQLG